MRTEVAKADHWAQKTSSQSIHPVWSRSQNIKGLAILVSRDSRRRALSHAKPYRRFFKPSVTGRIYEGENRHRFYVTVAERRIFATHSWETTVSLHSFAQTQTRKNVRTSRKTSLSCRDQIERSKALNPSPDFRANDPRSAVSA
jgi:hypothetical protein